MDIKVLLVDDHALVREGLKTNLENSETYRYHISEAENGAIAINLCQQNTYDIVFMDLTMPIMDGIECSKTILAKNPKTKIIALSMHDESVKIKNMMDSGVKAYLMKNVESDELEKAIDWVLKGKTYLPDEVQEKLNDFEQNNTKKLSKRELEVLSLIANELTNEEIAAQLEVSKRTIDTHRQNILTKIKAKNTAGLLRYAFSNNLV